ncbi:MAG: DUF421 domain-containing protein [Clostridiales bacterium]|nr:DUF421 domain-containing protein [Clostridiales bacterium]
MFIVFLRVLIIYVTVLVFLRMMGKRQIGEMQPYEVVITLIIADLATLPMSDTNIPLLNGILPLAILVLIHYVITLLTRKSIKIRRIMSGRPVIIISPNGIEYSALKQLNMNIDDLLEMVRQSGYYSFDQILYAIIETNGKISVIPTSACAPATAEDVGKNNPPAELPRIIIADGKILKEQMKISGLDNKKLNKILKYYKIQIKDLIILSLDNSGKLYFQIKGENFKLINNIYEEIKL